ncbi:hypothetical protein SDC9_128285 [bioreactor metagenome]|uniref:Uncharacterized protein n=1 Tax=bioreactor metagenome TaxID=1076179 RepID=A0A645CWI8_9ZZZZ
MRFSSFLSDSDSRCTAVMTVCDIKVAGLLKCFFNCLIYVLIFDFPHSLANTVTDKIINRLTSANISDHFFNGRITPIRQKYRPCVGITSADVANPVLFFIFSRKLVFFDMTLYIIINAGTADNAMLASAVHGLTINIKFIFFIVNTNTIRHQFI